MDQDRQSHISLQIFKFTAPRLKKNLEENPEKFKESMKQLAGQADIPPDELLRFIQCVAEKKEPHLPVEKQQEMAFMIGTASAKQLLEEKLRISKRIPEARKMLHEISSQTGIPFGDIIEYSKAQWLRIIDMYLFPEEL